MKNVKKKLKKNETGEGWWHQVLSRREASARIGKITTFAAAMALVGISIEGCGDDIDRDSLELQLEKGWAIGAEGEVLSMPASTEATLARSGTAWKEYNTPGKLFAAYQPRSTRWQPFIVATLIQSLDQKSLASQIVAYDSKEMQEAYSRGLGMREIVQKDKEALKTLLVVDLPGPESVAFGAAMADCVEPIVTFDNWPHPSGVVASDQTLGAMLYHADTIQRDAKSRPLNAPAVFILDSNRLGDYSDESNLFDNRYVAKIPTADHLKALGINRILYVTPNGDVDKELDDINDDFVNYREAGLALAMLPATNFLKTTTSAMAVTKDSTFVSAMKEFKQVAKDSVNTSSQPTKKNLSSEQSVYHYGGGPSLWPLFFWHYGASSGAAFPMGNRVPSTNGVRRPDYKAERRPTVFSSQNIGGASGVGKQKPTGFGRVSTNVSSSGQVRSVSSSSNRKTTSGHSYRSNSGSSSSSGSSSYSGKVSSGRSGSYGRSSSSYSS